MKLVTLSDLHIGKWGSYGDDLITEAEQNEGNVFWLNGDIFEPDGDNVPDIMAYLKRLGGLHDRYDRVVWVAGNNDLEWDLLTGPVSDYKSELGDILGSERIHLLDGSPLVIGDFALIGNIGWSDGGLWEPSRNDTEWPNSPTQNREATEKYFRELFGERWDVKSHEFFAKAQADLIQDVTLLHDKRIVLGTHYVTSPKFVLYGSRPKYDYLNWYMGWDGHGMYSFAKPELAMVGHTHRAETKGVGGFPVHNISGSKKPTVFEL